MFPPPREYHTYCRSERDINKHTAQRRAISSAQAPLGIINSLFAPHNHEPLLPTPFTCFSWLHSSLRERSGRRQQPCGARPCAFFRTTQSTTMHWAKYQVPGTGSTCVYSSFCFFVVDFVLYLGPLRDFFFANYTRTTTADQNVTSPIQHSTDRAISSAKVALGTIKSLVALNHGPLLSAPFKYFS